MRLGFIVMVAVVAVAQTQPARGDRAGDEVDRYIVKSMVRQHIPGLSLVVIRDGTVVKSRGYGLASIELNVPATPETAYELASATKPLVASAVMLLVQEGKIALDDKVSSFVEGAPGTWNAITVRHLLSHTSGIKDYLSELRRDFPNDAPAEAIVRAAIDAPLNFAPGEKWSYSNTGYVVLGLIIRKLTETSYDAFLNERVFKPLGMSSTRRDSPDDVIRNRAIGYVYHGPVGLRNGEYLKYLMTNHGDRGIVSTVLDLAKWDAALSSEQQRSTRANDAMWSQAKLNDGTPCGYGLGWFIDDVNGHRHVYHPGGAPGTATIIARYPDDALSILLLANGGGAYVQGLELGVAQRYLPGLVSRKVVKLTPERLDSYTGYYNVFGTQLLRISREDDHLVVDDGGRLANSFLPVSETEFVAEDADRGLTFGPAAAGVFSGITLRLLKDRVGVQRIGPLFDSLTARPPLDPALTRRLESVLKAFALGGRNVADVPGVAPQARVDYSRGPAPELAGIESLAIVHQVDVTGRGIERHGAAVTRVVYGRLLAGGSSRRVLVYLTAEGLVTDQDVIND
jgi:CubicO group peptidase (beta-lactamase class C family)